MCGIAGIVSFDQPAPYRNKAELMTGSMHHRGPDATGFYSNDQISLGHNRLSIIDLSACSNQPMADHTGRFHIVFNGEIYNYRSLRDKLTYPFTTNGDTEVILAAYSAWGTDCVTALEGMFAFAIWDDHKKELFLARDRMGVKPLYYSENGPTFAFASEIRALLNSGLVSPTINLHAVSEFLQYQSVSFPDTIIEGITMVDAATWMLVNKTGKVVTRYWNLWGTDVDFDYGNRKAVLEKTRDLLAHAVHMRMVSDVPVAAFLSGGIDSSAVVGLMARQSAEPVNTFTVGFNEKEFDESAFAAQVSKKFNTRHQEIHLQASRFLDELLPALNAMDMPSGDGVNSYVVSKAIKEHGIKVALSGIGGDELFAGYPIFEQYRRLMRFSSLWHAASPLRKVASLLTGNHSSKNNRIRQILLAEEASIASFYPSFRQVVPRSMIADCTNLPADAFYPGKGVLADEGMALRTLPLYSQVSVAEYLGYTQHTLLRDIDQMSMANSIEVREPFFDHHLVNFVLNAPDAVKYPHIPKQMMVEALDDLLPAEIVHRKKQGFVLPWKPWMKNELRTFCEDHIQAVGDRSFIKKEPLVRRWKQFADGDPSIRWMEIWLFVVLEYWLQKNNVS